MFNFTLFIHQYKITQNIFIAVENISNIVPTKKSVNLLISNNQLHFA